MIPTRFRPRRPRGSRTAPYSSTLVLLVTDAHCAIEELRDEMVEWRDNLDCNGMDHMPKYEEVSEAADQLDCVVESLSYLADAIEDIASHLPHNIREAKITLTQDTRRKSGARWGRLANAQEMAHAAYDAAAQILKDASVSWERSSYEEDRPEWADTLEESLDSWEQGINETQDVCFPGMY